MLVTLPSPIPKLQHAPLPLKMLRAKEHALTPCFSVVFSLDSHLSPLRSLGVRRIHCFAISSFNVCWDFYIGTNNTPKTLSFCMHDNDNDGFFKFTYLKHCIPSWQCFCSSSALCWRLHSSCKKALCSLLFFSMYVFYVSLHKSPSRELFTCLLVCRNSLNMSKWKRRRSNNRKERKKDGGVYCSICCSC